MNDSQKTGDEGEGLRAQAKAKYARTVWSNEVQDTDTDTGLYSRYLLEEMSQLDPADTGTVLARRVMELRGRVVAVVLR